MMHGPEKSDPAIVAGKPTNKAETGGREVTHVPTAKEHMRRLVRNWHIAVETL
jgi:hypothetical protein